MSKQNPEKSFDVVIIGGGAAGMSAALWCDELGLKTLLVEEQNALGGQLWRVYNPIKNHLGGEAKNGREMQKIFLKQINQRKFETLTESKIIEVNCKKKLVAVKNVAPIKWRFLVIATGVARRSLGLESEEKFKGAGVLNSGQGAAKSIKNKCVAIVGGGDAALENALILAAAAAEVTVIHRRRDLTARAEFIEKAQQNQQIKFLTETIVTKFGGGKKLEFIELKNTATKENSILFVEAVLVRIGVEPNTEIFRGKVEMDAQGYIKINETGETNIKDVFAIGDVANPLAPTISSAIGMGATTAKTIFNKHKSK